MSSILKALKKIDDNSQPPQAFPSLPAAIDAKKAITRGVKRRWFFRRRVTLALMLMVAAAAVMILFYRPPSFLSSLRPQTSSTAPAASRKNQSVFRSKIPMTRTDAVIVHSGDKRAAAMPETSHKPARLAADNRPAPASRRRPQRSIAHRTNPKASPGVRKTRVKTKAPFNPPAAGGKSVTAKRSGSRQTLTRLRKPPRKKTAADSTYDRLDNSNLKLQALAWSSDAARRLAVINGHVVHEGEAVEGYQVTRIRREDVIVNDGRKSWRLVFGLQQ